MGKNRREKREEEREGYATKRSSQYRARNLKAIGILSMIGVIVSFACYEFVTSTNNVPGAPENAGKLGDEHIHASMLVKIFGDKFDFTSPNYQVATPWIHFENSDGDTVHRHSTGVELEFMFNSMKIAVDAQCFVFPDGRQFCNNNDYSLKYYVNQKKVDDITNYIIQEDDRILISYGRRRSRNNR